MIPQPSPDRSLKGQFFLTLKNRPSSSERRRFFHFGEIHAQERALGRGPLTFGSVGAHKLKTKALKQ